MHGLDPFSTMHNELLYIYITVMMFLKLSLVIYRYPKIFKGFQLEKNQSKNNLRKFFTEDYYYYLSLVLDGLMKRLTTIKRYFSGDSKYVEYNSYSACYRDLYKVTSRLIEISKLPEITYMYYKVLVYENISGSGEYQRYNRFLSSF